MAVARGPTSFVGSFEEVVDVLGGLVDGVRDLADDEVVAGLDAVRSAQARLDALRAGLVAEADGRLLAEADGRGSTAAWLAGRERSNPAAARRLVRHARELPELPRTSEALTHGRITWGHAQRLMRACRAEVATEFARDEEMMVGWAETLTWPEFETAMSQWELFADPERQEVAEDRAWAERTVFFSRLGDRYVGDISTDIVTGESVSSSLEVMTRRMFDDDWAEAAERLGRRPCASDLRRTNAQRRHDALIELLHVGVDRAGCSPVRDTPSGSGGVVIVCDERTFAAEVEAQVAQAVGATGDAGDPRCHTLGGAPVSPRTAVSVAMSGFVRRLVGDLPSSVIDFSAEKRWFSASQKLAMRIRDLRCVDCGESVFTTEADHDLAWLDGGLTDLANGKPRCRRCHRAKTNRENRRRHPPRDGPVELPSKVGTDPPDRETAGSAT